MENEELFHNEYLTFIQSVETLSKSAEESCEIMGFYNVAWELKDDISAGTYLLSNPATILNNEHNSSIQNLIAELNKVPESVLVFSNIKEESLKAMQQPCWEPLRRQAASLVQMLENVTKINKEYYNKKP